MIYTESVKQLKDGRYFTKISKDENGNRMFKQFNSVTLLSNFSEAMNVVLDVTKHVETFSIFDNENITAAKKYSESWFGKTLNDKTLEAAYSKPVSQDGELTVTKVSPQVVIYNHDKTVVNPEDLKDNTVCDVILELSGILFSKKTFSPVWRLVQVKLPSPPKKNMIQSFLFEDHVEEESEEDEFL